VHAAQGATADTTHAVLSRTATRALAYVALTRGRDTNTAYLYERTAEHEHPEQPSSTSHVMARGTRQHAGRLLRAILANDARPTTAHDLAATVGATAVPASVRDALDRRATARHHRTVEHSRWHTAITLEGAASEARTREAGLHRSSDDGLEL
jgi:hypothetical protein